MRTLIIDKIDEINESEQKETAAYKRDIFSDMVQYYKMVKKNNKQDDVRDLVENSNQTTSVFTQSYDLPSGRSNNELTIVGNYKKKQLE